MLQSFPETGFFCNEIYDGAAGEMSSSASNLGSSWFGYALGLMVELGFTVVGQDQLAGGPPLDNDPSVSMLDWKTGQPLECEILECSNAGGCFWHWVEDSGGRSRFLQQLALLFNNSLCTHYLL